MIVRQRHSNATPNEKENGAAGSGATWTGSPKGFSRDENIISVRQGSVAKGLRALRDRDVGFIDCLDEKWLAWDKASRKCRSACHLAQSKVAAFGGVRSPRGTSSFFFCRRLVRRCCQKAAKKHERKICNENKNSPKHISSLWHDLRVSDNRSRSELVCFPAG